MAVFHMVVVDDDLAVGRPSHLDDVAKPLDMPLLDVGEQVAVVRGVVAFRLLDRNAVGRIGREWKPIGESLNAAVPLACRPGEHLLRGHLHGDPARERKKGVRHHLPVAIGDTAPAEGRGLQTNGA